MSASYLKSPAPCEGEAETPIAEQVSQGSGADIPKANCFGHDVSPLLTPQIVVEALMVAVREDLKVLDSVVSAVEVLVVDY